MDGRWAALSHAAPRRAPARVPDYSVLQRPLPAEIPTPPVIESDIVAQQLSATVGPQGEAFIEHVIAPTDTIEGVSLRYGVTVAEIKMVNDLPTSNLRTAGRTLRIPLTQGSRVLPTPQASTSRAAILRRFRVVHGLGEAEAKYYLDGADYDEGAAAKELAADLATEAALPSQRSAPLHEAGNNSTNPHESEESRLLAERSTLHRRPVNR